MKNTLIYIELSLKKACWFLFKKDEVLGNKEASVNSEAILNCENSFIFLIVVNSLQEKNNTQKRSNPALFYQHFLEQLLYQQ